MVQFPDDSKHNPWGINPWQNGAKFDEKGEPLAGKHVPKEAPRASDPNSSISPSLADLFASDKPQDVKNYPYTVESWSKSFNSQSLLYDETEFKDIQVPASYKDIFSGDVIEKRRKFKFINVLNPAKFYSGEKLSRSFPRMGIIKDDKRNSFIPVDTLKVLLERGSPLKLDIDFSTRVIIDGASYYPLLDLAEDTGSLKVFGFSEPNSYSPDRANNASPLSIKDLSLNPLTLAEIKESSEDAEVMEFFSRAGLAHEKENHGFRKFFVNKDTGILSLPVGSMIFSFPDLLFVPVDFLKLLIKEGSPLSLNIDFSNLFSIGSKTYFRLLNLDEPKKCFKVLTFVDGDDFPSGIILLNKKPSPEALLRLGLKSLDKDLFNDLSGTSKPSLRIKVLEYAGLNATDLVRYEDGALSMESLHPPAFIVNDNEVEYENAELEKSLESIDSGLAVDFDDFKKEVGNNPQLKNKSRWIVDPEKKDFNKKQES